jgi:hypothetical protein
MFVPLDARWLTRPLKFDFRRWLAFWSVAIVGNWGCLAEQRADTVWLINADGLFVCGATDRERQEHGATGGILFANEEVLGALAITFAMIDCLRCRRAQFPSVSLNGLCCKSLLLWGVVNCCKWVDIHVSCKSKFVCSVIVVSNIRRCSCFWPACEPSVNCSESQIFWRFRKLL